MLLSYVAGVLISALPLLPAGIGVVEAAIPAVLHHFGAPLDFSGRALDERSARSLREVAEQIRVAVQALSGQEYVDRYAPTDKSAD